jgi:hypothetical protein
MLPPSLSHWVMRAVIPLFQDLSYWGTCVVQLRKEAWGATEAGGACSKKKQEEAQGASDAATVFGRAGPSECSDA